MKVLIAGFGSIGRRHFRNLRRLGIEDILFYSTRKSTLDTEEIAEFILESDLDKALAHKPDAVIVSNPTSMHLDVAIPAAEAGCHLMIEKPISHNMDRLDDLQEQIKRTKKKVLIGFQFRYHPGLIQIKNMIDAGQIGKPVSVRAHWGEYLPDWHPWEDYREGYSARADLGGGVVLTLCHPFDYLRWLLGDVKTIQALLGLCGDLGLEGVEDTAEVNLFFKNGVIGNVHLNYSQRPAVHKLQLIGSEGTISWNGLDGALRVYKAGEASWEVIPQKKGFTRNDLFLEEVKHFLKVVAGEEEPICSLEDGIAIQKMIQLIKLSNQEKKTLQIHRT